LKKKKNKKEEEEEEEEKCLFFLFSFLFFCYIAFTAVAQWLRCCATNRKAAGSIPDCVIGIFHWHNPSDRTMALGST